MIQKNPPSPLPQKKSTGNEIAVNIHQHQNRQELASDFLMYSNPKRILNET